MVFGLAYSLRFTACFRSRLLVLIIDLRFPSEKLAKNQESDNFGWIHGIKSLNA